MLCFALVVVLFAADASQVTALLRSGLQHLQQGKVTDARSELEQASRLDAQNPLVWASLAQTYGRLKQPKQANAAAANAEKFGNGNPIVAHALAMYYSESGQFAHAAALEQEYAASPNADHGALARAAGLYLSAGDADKAVRLAQQAVSFQASSQAQDILGRALIAAGQPAAGIEHLKLAWEFEQTNPQIAFDYAQTLLHQQDFMQAAQVLGQAVKTNPKNPQLTLAMGVTRYGQRRFPEAIAAFLQTISIDPRIPQPYIFLGRVLDQAGPALPEIINDYRRRLTNEPKNADAYLLLAKALVAANPESDEPETLLKRSIELDPGNWESHYQLGLVLVKKRSYKEAATELERSIQLNAKEAMPHYHLARVYDRLGQRDRAQAEREMHQRLSGSKSTSGMEASGPQLPQ